MTDSAGLKIHRATEHVNELNVLFQKQRPFTYVLETNAKTGQRATFAKRNESVIHRAAIICGDAVHNLRAALDHAYWDIVSPFAATDKERRGLQFPFSETEARLDEAVKTRLADRVSPSFYQILLDLKPHGEPGGNEYPIITRVMELGDYADVEALDDAVGEAALRDALLHAEAGEFSPRSWHYWHYRLGLVRQGEVPPLPQRRFE